MSKQGWASILSCIMILGIGAMGALWIYGTVVVNGGTGPLLAISAQTEDAAVTVNPSKEASQGTTPPSTQEVIKKSQLKVFTVTTTDSLGSGFLFNKHDDVLTNAHVVEGASNVTLTGPDKTEYAGTVIGIGSDMDIAVIRAPGLAGKEPLKLETEKAELGDPVLALGSPLGLENTATTGIISGVDRTFDHHPYVYNNMYQTSAPIAQGNSGGPLIHLETGKVVGINSAIIDQGAIGFSIPVSQVIAKAEEWTGYKLDGSTASTGKDPDHASSSGNAAISNQQAEDLVYNFYDYLNAEDYVSAYALLGSEWQKGTAYEEFRAGFLKTTQSQVSYVSSVFDNKKGTAQVDGLITAEERKDGNAYYRSYEIGYEVAYENGNLKLIAGTLKPLE
ncbi:S1C family serine protease [Paenibacillus lautus]|uniref:S1C family serine protease n=1 Tax=Paenibacillus lautus TaxID=1401 RepID=UPI001C11315A|nr:trypsin-like peptidase domain-containing protein [Paenibacillus lautus]MBU5347567.1 S1C family serine protease [Paenibacillus lautus]